MRQRLDAAGYRIKCGMTAEGVVDVVDGVVYAVRVWLTLCSRLSLRTPLGVWQSRAFRQNW